MDLIIDGPSGAAVTLALAHGAGAGADTPFMNTMADGLAERGIRVARFEFPYMAKHRADGRRRPPDRPETLIACWREVIAALAGPRPVIGGKSMGGRIASMIADEVGAAGLVCLGYPFHPPSRPERTRIDHLAALATPTLILQGERDALGARAEVECYPLASAIRVHWLPDGDHDLRPRKRSGHTWEGNLENAVAAVASFVTGL